MSGNMVGRSYTLRGEPVTVVIQWRTGVKGAPRGPRNVLVRRSDGSLDVVESRPLRKPKP